MFIEIFDVSLLEKGFKKFMYLCNNIFMKNIKIKFVTLEIYYFYFAGIPVIL